MGSSFTCWELIKVVGEGSEKTDKARLVGDDTGCKGK